MEQVGHSTMAVSIYGSGGIGSGGSSSSLNIFHSCSSWSGSAPCTGLSPHASSAGKTAAESIRRQEEEGTIEQKMAPCLAIAMPHVGSPGEGKDQAFLVTGGANRGKNVPTTANEDETNEGGSPPRSILLYNHPLDRVQSEEVVSRKTIKLNLVDERGAAFPRDPGSANNPPPVAPAATEERKECCPAASPSSSSLKAEREIAVAKEQGVIDKQQQQQQQRQPQRQQNQAAAHSPLGSMFRPELDRAGVVAVVSEVLCRPGFTRGPDDERRLLKSVRTGRVDIQDMSRLLRWLARERVGLELKRRGIEFVGPQGQEAAQPYTSGEGMDRLLHEVVSHGHPAGTCFIVSFSSRFDACSSAISGELVDASSLSVSELSTSNPDSSAESGTVASANARTGDCSDLCGGEPVSEETRTASTCSSSTDIDNDEEDDDLAVLRGATPLPARVGGTTQEAGALQGLGMSMGSAADPRFILHGESVTGSSSSSSPTSTTPRGGGRQRRVKNAAGRRRGKEMHEDSSIVALLLDEKPGHRRRNSGTAPGSYGVAGSCSGNHSGVCKMRVREWVESYGECDGPMLAAWVFPGRARALPGQ